MRSTFELGAAVALVAAGCASVRPSSSTEAGLPELFAAHPAAAWVAGPAPVAPPSALEDAVAATDAAAPAAKPASSGGWRFEITPFLWVPAMDGELGVGQLDGNIDMSMGDFVDAVSDHGQNVVILHVEAKTDAFGVFGEFLHLDLEGEGERSRTFGGQQIGPITIPTTTVTVGAEVGFEMTTAELGLTYTLDTFDVTGALEGKAPVELIGGVRYYEVENTVELTTGLDVGLEEEWYDPFVGIRLLVPLGRTVHLLVRSDLGGFGLGDASDLSYRVTTMLQWNLSKHVDLLAGWSLLDVDYETGSGRDRFEFDVRMSGPAAALTIRF